MIKEVAGLKGSLIATLYRPNGEIEVHRKDNIIVSGGFDFICDVIGNNSSRPAAMGFIAVGAGMGEADISQTELENEVLRKAATYSHTPGTKIFTITATFLPGEATAAITEAGVLNADTDGILLDRVVFGVINKGEQDTLTCQFQFTLS